MTKLMAKLSKMIKLAIQLPNMLKVKVYIKIQILLTGLHTFPYSVSWENFIVITLFHCYNLYSW